MATTRFIKVFIASPGDVAVERRAFKDTVESLNKGFGLGADVEFVPLGWEDVLSQVGRRSQSVINQDVDACDVFILVMWRRWGQAAPDAGPYTSYTEEEFWRAVARYEKSGKPTIHVFFKEIESGQMADPGDQLKKVLAFRSKLEQSRKVLYRGFADEKGFSIEIKNHLIAFVKSPPSADAPHGDVPILPDSVQLEVERYRQDALKALHEIERFKLEALHAVAQAEQARADAHDAITRARAIEVAAEAKAASRTLDLAELAAKAALDGRIEEARQSFAKALDGTANLDVLYLGYRFYQRIGELEEAERLLKRWLAISGRDQPTASTAAALSNLGLIALARGDLGEAEKLQRESMEIHSKIGRLEEQASNLGNLGLIAMTRGDLGEAEKFHSEALEIDRKFGHLEGQASQLGNLGWIAQTCGDLNAAEKLHHEAMTIERKLGRLENQANQLGNLGVIAQTRGDLDAAEKLFREVLEIDCKLGRLESQATVLGNLGVIAQIRGDHNGAEKFHREALDIGRKLGGPEVQANSLGNLGLIARARGDLDGAEKLHLEALEIDRKLGRMAGQANQLGNLGLIAQSRGDLDVAEKRIGEALEIDRKLGRLQGQAIALGNLGTIAKQRGNIASSRQFWTQSRDLFTRIGMPHKVNQIQGQLESLPPE